MLILLQSMSERSEFSWLQRFRWFWSSFSLNIYGIAIPQFHKIRCPNRYLRACIECAETPGFQIPIGRLFCIMHALLLSTNWFQSNVGGMLLPGTASYEFEYCVKWMLIHRGPTDARMQAHMHAAAIAMAPGMNGGKVSLFHVFRANVLRHSHIWCKQLDRISARNPGFRVTSMLFADSTVHDA
jgi:hypothetical protein